MKHDPGIEAIANVILKDATPEDMLGFARLCDIAVVFLWLGQLVLVSFIIGLIVCIIKT